MKQNKKKTKTTKGFKDTFNISRLKNIKLMTEMELAYIHAYKGPLPSKVINILRNPSDPEKYFVHHYLYDYAFDGRNGVWYGCIESNNHSYNYMPFFDFYQA